MFCPVLTVLIPDEEYSSREASAVFCDEYVHVFCLRVLLLVHVFIQNSLEGNLQGRLQILRSLEEAESLSVLRGVNSSRVYYKCFLEFLHPY